MHRMCIGCLILIGHFPQKNPIFSSSFAKRDLQLMAFFACSPPCTSNTSKEINFYQERPANKRDPYKSKETCNFRNSMRFRRPVYQTRQRRPISIKKDLGKRPIWVKRDLQLQEFYACSPPWIPNTWKETNLDRPRKETYVSQKRCNLDRPRKETYISQKGCSIVHMSLFSCYTWKETNWERPRKETYISQKRCRKETYGQSRHFSRTWGPQNISKETLIPIKGDLHKRPKEISFAEYKSLL